MATSQTELFQYGIQNERSDIRAHVSPLGKMVHVFQTRKMIEFLNEHGASLKTAPAFQPGVMGRTAEGYKVPLRLCGPLVRCLNFVSYPWDTFPPKTATTSEKGAAAVAVVVALLGMGRFPLWVVAHDDTRKTIQISGTDIVVFANQRIQVKCDYSACPMESGGTGNLYIQFAERNPRKFT